MYSVERYYVEYPNGEKKWIEQKYHMNSLLNNEKIEYKIINTSHETVVTEEFIKRFDEMVKLKNIKLNIGVIKNVES